MTVSHSRRRAPRGSGGFTLIEVLLVLVILVTLASLAVTAYDGIREKANKDAAKVQIGLFKDQLGLYKLTVRSYPTNDQGLEALRNPPGDLANADSWAGPYIEGTIPMDPWGNPYQYQFPGKNNANGYDLWSFGQNGTDGDEDDVGNWSEG